MSESATKVKWTSGKWYADPKHFNGEKGPDKSFGIICEGEDEWVIAEVCGDVDEHVANARLIAASPDLFEALNRMLVSFAGMDEELCMECGEKTGTGESCDTCYVIGMAIAAVEKAVGAEID